MRQKSALAVITTTVLLAVSLFTYLTGCGRGGGDDSGLKATPTYAVIYDGNGNTGGSVPIDSNIYNQGQTVTVLGNTGNLVNTGYSFVGWNTQANGLGTTYTQGQTLTIYTTNITLYAMWTI